MNNIEEIINHIKSEIASDNLCGYDELTITVSDLSALIAQLEAAQKERDALREVHIGAGSNTRAAADIYFQLVEELKVPAGGSLVGVIENLKAELSAVQLDAARWRAMLSSPAIRILGYAGLQDDKPIDGHYCHFGMEIWSHYEPYYDNKKAGELITRYADNMIAASLVEGNADAE